MMTGVELFERRDVWVADEDGDNWCRVAANGAHPAWSPDGEQLAFAHRTLDVKLVPTTNDRGETGSEWVVEGRVDIWVTPTEGGPWRRVTNTTADEYDLDWSAGRADRLYGQHRRRVRDLGGGRVGDRRVQAPRYRSGRFQVSAFVVA